MPCPGQHRGGAGEEIVAAEIAGLERQRQPRSPRRERRDAGIDLRADVQGARRAPRRRRPTSRRRPTTSRGSRAPTAPAASSAKSASKAARQPLAAMAACAAATAAGSRRGIDQRRRAAVALDPGEARARSRLGSTAVLGRRAAAPDARRGRPRSAPRSPPSKSPTARGPGPRRRRTDARRRRWRCRNSPAARGRCRSRR